MENYIAWIKTAAQLAEIFDGDAARLSWLANQTARVSSFATLAIRANDARIDELAQSEKMLSDMMTSGGVTVADLDAQMAQIEAVGVKLDARKERLLAQLANQ